MIQRNVEINPTKVFANKINLTFKDDLLKFRRQETFANSLKIFISLSDDNFLIII